MQHKLWHPGAAAAATPLPTLVLYSAAGQTRPCKLHRTKSKASSGSAGLPEDAYSSAKQAGVAAINTAAASRPQQQDDQQERQQQQQPGMPVGYDPKLAAGFLPPPGEKPMWWVQKFEERRKKLAEQEQPQQGSSSGQNNPTTAPPASTYIWVPTAALQLLQLAVVNAGLILWPATLYPGGLSSGHIWLLYLTYMLFLAGGSVYRLMKYGPLTDRKKDVQGKAWWSTAAWLLFVFSVPIIHWPPVLGFLKMQQQFTTAGMRGMLTLYDVLGFGFLVSAVALNWWAARHLGKAYDRVVTPDALITDGPYAHIQHPIYTSYMLLFMGYGLMLHSAATALFALVVCSVYYWSRTRLEAGVLQQAFGEQYIEYSKKTKLFFPYVL